MALLVLSSSVLLLVVIQEIHGNGSLRLTEVSRVILGAIGLVDERPSMMGYSQ